MYKFMFLTRLMHDICAMLLFKRNVVVLCDLFRLICEKLLKSVRNPCGLCFE